MELKSETKGAVAFLSAQIFPKTESDAADLSKN